MAVDYAKEREQFDRPIGAYQAVSHRLAEMLWDVEEARSLDLLRRPGRADAAAGVAAARRLDGEGPRLRRGASVTHSAIQTFGGIGFTWEHDIHFLLKRAQVSAQLLGTRASTASASPPLQDWASGRPTLLGGLATKSRCRRVDLPPRNAPEPAASPEPLRGWVGLPSPGVEGRGDV